MVAHVSITDDAYRSKSMPSVAGRRLPMLLMSNKCWYSVLNHTISQPVLRYSSAALKYLGFVSDIPLPDKSQFSRQFMILSQCVCMQYFLSSLIAHPLLFRAFSVSFLSLRPTVIFMVDEKSKQIETGPAGHPLEFRACKIGQFHQTPLENWGLRMMGAADRKIYLSVSFSILIINYDNKGSRSWFDNCIIHSQVNAKCCRTKAANAVLIKVVKCWCSVLNHHNSQPQS